MPENFEAKIPVVAVEASSGHTPPEAPPPPPLLEKIRAWRRRMPLAVRLPLALVFLMIGVIGGFIPILQGWVFVLAALWLIFPDHAEQIVDKIRAWLQRFRRKS